MNIHIIYGTAYIIIVCGWQPVWVESGGDWQQAGACVTIAEPGCAVFNVGSMCKKNCTKSS